MLKNVAGQKVYLSAWNLITDSPETGYAASIAIKIEKDGGGLGDPSGGATNPAELDNTNAKGVYVYSPSATDSNADCVFVTGVPDDAFIVVSSVVLYTRPANFSDMVIDGSGRVDVGKWLGQAVTLSSGNKPDVNVNEVSDDSVAADNLEAQYDRTGVIGDTFPFTQSEGAAIGGGLAINITMTSVTVIEGSEQGLANASTSDDSRWTGDDDGSGAEFIFRCTPADTSDIPVEIMFEGYYDEPVGATNGATLQVYNFNTAIWDTIGTFTNSTKDENHEVPLSHAHKAPGGGTLETVAYTIGDVLVKFKQDTTETGNACLLIDLILVGFVGNLVTAEEIVDEWENQSQADPTGFHVNVKEINGTSQTANDNGADINTLITQVGTAGAGLTDLGGMSTGMKAGVEAEATDALAAYDPPTKAELDAAESNIRGADSDTLETLSDQLDGINNPTGAGSITFTYTVTDADSGDPIADVDVWVTTDAAGANVVAGTLQTNAVGVVVFMLDPGNYYIWRQRSGYNFSDPDLETVV